MISPNSQFEIRNSRFRPGITLIELLVVVAILSIITATAIPLMAPAVESRRLREASRGLSTFIAGARARAIDRDRPVGVEFVPVSADGLLPAAVDAYYVEVPPMYAGDSTTSNANFTAVDSSSGTATVTLNGAAAATALVRNGDKIRFNFQGPWWKINDPAAGPGEKITSTTINISVTSNVAIPWTTTSPNPAFQIRRQPVRSSAASFQMPGNAAVDLQFSGIDSDVFPVPAGNRRNVTIMFAPEGHVQSLIDANGGTSSVTGAIYLLVGGIEKIPVDISSTATWTEENCNLLDGINQWVAIGVQNGQAVSAEMTFIDPAIAQGRTPREVVTEARRLASDMRGQSGN
ncbi:MAG: prepilin-type N-terminal cleavage/methylation domain-containing protein [Planctomycetales bacterium]|nr:prepilin-type N-terminal cleavage/methylation domain-containing protein [Planctomycetales bacterium]